MARVIADMSMSLDGFIADPDDSVDHLFGWYGNGAITTPTANPGVTFRTSEASARRLRDALSDVGALVTGRRLFDLTGGWGGRHPMGVPVFVVTHEPPSTWDHPEAPFTFVTDGVVSAIEQAMAVADRRDVGIASAKVTQQALDVGLIDALHVNLIPVLLGRGVPWFETLRTAPIVLADPTVVCGEGVTHLIYEIRRPEACRPTRSPQ